MTPENQHFDRKSLRKATGKTAAWAELALGLVHTTGRTKGLRYFVAPTLLRGAKVPTVTTLARIEPHRLRALILEDLARYPGSASSEINGRVGPELSVKTIKRALDELETTGQVVHEGERRWRRYWLAPKGQTAGESAVGR